MDPLVYKSLVPPIQYPENRIVHSDRTVTISNDREEHAWDVKRFDIDADDYDNFLYMDPILAYAHFETSRNSWSADDEERIRQKVDELRPLLVIIEQAPGVKVTWPAEILKIADALVILRFDQQDFEQFKSLEYFRREEYAVSELLVPNSNEVTEVLISQRQRRLEGISDRNSSDVFSLITSNIFPKRDAYGNYRDVSIYKIIHLVYRRFQ